MLPFVKGAFAMFRAFEGAKALGLGGGGMSPHPELVVREVDWYGDDAAAAAASAGSAGLLEAAEALLTLANQTVPHDEGVLEGSGTVGLIDDTTAFVSYDAPYAVRLHEHPGYSFQGGRRGKWLELALQENEDALMRVVGDRIRDALG